ncbi:MAG: hypothetical protein GF411_12835 [Candidatus Lokiarchaeota archaeon]|nr:hypothetical protein [Candidatus Lokiarchaeota archaeon]
MSSMLSVVGASRISNTVYFAAGSILWTALLVWVDFNLTVDINTGLVVVGGSSIFGTIFWAITLEKRVLFPIIHYLTMKRARDFTRWMANDLLLIKPWQTSIVPYVSIEEKLECEVESILRSKLLEPDMERLFMLFYLLLTSIPFGYLVINSIPIEFSLRINVLSCAVLVGFILYIVISIFVLYDLRERPRNILTLSYFDWLRTTISNDRSRRERKIFRSRSGPTHRLEELEVLYDFSGEVLVQMRTKHWKWLDEALASYRDLRGPIFSLTSFQNDYNDFIEDILHCFRLQKGTTHLDTQKQNIYSVVLRTGAVQSISEILDVIESVKHIKIPWDIPDLRYIEETKDILKVFRSIANLFSVANYVRLLKSMDSVSFKFMSANVCKELAQHVYLHCEQKTPSFQSDPTPERVILYLLEASKSKCISSTDVFSIGQKWKVSPSKYISKLSNDQSRLFYEYFWNRNTTKLKTPICDGVSLLLNRN